MKMLLSILTAVILLASCTKTVVPENTQAKMTQTFAIDSLKQKSVTYHFDRDPATAKLWRIQFWWADGYGYNLPAPENIGHGTRLTPEYPEFPNGKQVAQHFTWWIDNGTRMADIGGNKAEVSLPGNQIIIHQFPLNANEQEQIYYGHGIMNNDGMGEEGHIGLYD